MSDTDSVVLIKPLPQKLIGTEIGQMKLEYEFKKGIFIRKKLYYLLTHDGKEIIKASGVDSQKLNYNSFKLLLENKSITIQRTEFKVGWKDLTLKIENSDIKLQGLIGGIKNKFNVIDTNFKSIVKLNLDFILIGSLDPLPIFKNSIILGYSNREIIIWLTPKLEIILYKNKYKNIIFYPLINKSSFHVPTLFNILFYFFVYLYLLFLSLFFIFIYLYLFS